MFALAEQHALMDNLWWPCSPYFLPLFWQKREDFYSWHTINWVCMTWEGINVLIPSFLGVNFIIFHENVGIKSWESKGPQNGKPLYSPLPQPPLLNKIFGGWLKLLFSCLILYKPYCLFLGGSQSITTYIHTVCKRGRKREGQSLNASWH